MPLFSHGPQNDVTAKMDLLWKFLKPISFALIGKEVNFAHLDGTVVAYGTIILIVGSAVSLPLGQEEDGKFADAVGAF